VIDKVIALDEEWRKQTNDITTMKTALNKLQREVIAPKKKAKVRKRNRNEGREDRRPSFPT